MLKQVDRVIFYLSLNLKYFLTSKLNNFCVLFDLIYYCRDRLVFALAAAFPPCRSGRGRYVLVFTTTRTRSISGLLSYIVPFLGSRFNIEREKFSNYLFSTN